ncbi:MAG: PrsW family intramembrane metalloprotease [Candidatus Pacebacteria bacterium]|nr:PrsW family intramembrane metalloprotease [Candidatus Paceibacterota bacterium]
MSLGQIFIYALLGGILPSLLWLWFFLKEDSARPEPRWLIMASFLSGMLAVLLALPVEMLVKCVASGTWPSHALSTPLVTINYCRDLADVQPVFLWAATEELLKYLVAIVIVLWRRAVDEPVDAMIYLITVALGFAALETGLFLMGPLGRGDITGGILTGNLRFMGAALIHTLSSAVVGFAIAITFFRAYWIQFLSLCTGLILAIMLHALFNHHIIASGGGNVAIVFFSVWLGIIILFLLFERAKRITRPHTL